MPKHPSAGVKTDRVKGKDINGQVVTLERTQPRQLSLFQTFLSDEERGLGVFFFWGGGMKLFWGGELGLV